MWMAFFFFFVCAMFIGLNILVFMRSLKLVYLLSEYKFFIYWFCICFYILLSCSVVLLIFFLVCMTSETLQMKTKYKVIFIITNLLWSPSKPFVIFVHWSVADFSSGMEKGASIWCKFVFESATSSFVAFFRICCLFFLPIFGGCHWILWDCVALAFF